MKFRTEINIKPYGFKINYKDKITTFGSCFADNIADKFLYYKFNVLKNPFGVLYNPVSIANALQIIFNNKTFVENDLIFHNGLYHSFYHHGSFSDINPEYVLTKINSVTEQTREALKSSSLVILTFGTAFVYKHKKQNIIVSNCHKIPQAEFERFRLSVEGVVKEIVRSLKYLKLLSENVRVLLTVSPVRHWKDGAIENQRSKATLILAIDKVLRECENVYYFPSYELVLDDLRDYRFFEKDLLHPNSFAVEYIWEKFTDTFFDEETKMLIPKIEKIVKGLNHKPFNKDNPQYQKFVENLNKEIKLLKSQYPELNFD